MAATIAVTISDDAHKRLSAVQKQMTALRRAHNPGASKMNQADALNWILKHAPMPDTREETLDNCRKLCAELRRMGFDENSPTTSIIPEDALATAAYNQQPLSPKGLEQARYAGIYLVEYRFLEALGKGKYRLTGKDMMMQVSKGGLR